MLYLNFSTSFIGQFRIPGAKSIMWYLLPMAFSMSLEVLPIEFAFWLLLKICMTQILQGAGVLFRDHEVGMKAFKKML